MLACQRDPGKQLEREESLLVEQADRGYRCI